MKIEFESYTELIHLINFIREETIGKCNRGNKEIKRYLGTILEDCDGNWDSKECEVFKQRLEQLYRLLSEII